MVPGIIEMPAFASKPAAAGRIGSVGRSFSAQGDRRRYFRAVFTARPRQDLYQTFRIEAPDDCHQKCRPRAVSEPRTTAHVDFDAPAALRKWPSLNNERRLERAGPYLLLEGTLDECIRELVNKPAFTRHLYEIHTAPQPPYVEGVLSGEHVGDLARLRDFL
jgi:hypothetical protein